MKIKNFGFTLLELLVVISIIAILVVMGVASYTTAQKKGRDARRRADLKAAQNAFEQYYAVTNSSYPTSCMSANTISINVSGNIFTAVDPKNTGTSIYACTCTTGTSYSCTAQLENPVGPITITQLQ